MVGEHDNFKAGVFVLVGLVLGVVVIFVLGDWGNLLERRQEVKVYFTLSDGLQGLKTGASVTLGDQAVGAVASIEDHVATVGEDGEARVIGKVVTLEIPDRYKLYWTAQVELVSPPLGSGTRLNIASVGEGKRYEPSGPVPPEAIPPIFARRNIAYTGPAGAIPGSVAGSALTRNFVSDLGIEDLQKQQIQDIIANVQQLTAKLKDDVPAITGRVNKMLAKVEPAVEQVDGAVADARTALVNVRDMTGDLRQGTTRWVQRIDSITEKTDQTLGTVHAMVKEKDPTIRATLDNVHEITQKVKETNLQQITDALEQGKAALANAREATANLRDVVVGQRPVLERSLANAQLTTDQLKLAAIEIRRSPWRLLYKPKAQELETDNLYDATRSFSLAAGALDSAAQSLRAVAQNPSGAEQINPMLDHLEKLFARFEEAEKAFWEALKGRTPQP